TRSPARDEGAPSAGGRCPRRRPAACGRAGTRRPSGATRGRASDVRVSGARPFVQGRPGQRADAGASARHRAGGPRCRPRYPRCRARRRRDASRLTMQTLLNLLAGVSLLVWGTHIVRTGILRLYGGSLPRLLRQSANNRVAVFFAGVGVTALIQSSTATALIVAAFAGQGLIGTAPALAVMLGADVGTSLVVLVLSFDLSWLAPLLIFVGVVLFLSRQATQIGRFGRILIGLGLIMFALQWISLAAKPVVQAAGVKVIFASLTGDLLLDMLVAALLTIMCYSSLAVVLLLAALAGLQVLSLPVALGLVLGANLGSGLLGMLSTLRSPPEARRVTLGNFLFKLIGCVFAVPFVGRIETWIDGLALEPSREVVLFHLVFN